METCPDLGIAGHRAAKHLVGVDEPLIERSEVVALLFNVSEIVVRLISIERLLEEDDGQEEVDEG